ncbi:hypothetical protein FQN51_000542 [Onygenales sp. PD_10]|nr:hypothetical protein FQN51_000542 [Onygenales sp. PD_10]
MNITASDPLHPDSTHPWTPAAIGTITFGITATSILAMLTLVVAFRNRCHCKFALSPFWSWESILRIIAAEPSSSRGADEENGHSLNEESSDHCTNGSTGTLSPRVSWQPPNSNATISSMPVGSSSGLALANNSSSGGDDQ